METIGIAGLYGAYMGLYRAYIYLHEPLGQVEFGVPSLESGLWVGWLSLNLWCLRFGVWKIPVVVWEPFKVRSSEDGRTTSLWHTGHVEVVQHFSRLLPCCKAARWVRNSISHSQSVTVCRTGNNH